jgi:putative ABC transport system ATP-binding protein
MSVADAVEPQIPRHKPVLSARGLHRIYRSGPAPVHALRGLDLEVPAGEFVVLLGASGSGKSTLLNLFGGLDVPDAGELRVLNIDVGRGNEAQRTAYRRQHVGFVFQFYNLIGNLTAAENVQLVTDLVTQSIPPLEALALVGLHDRAHHFPAQLSGGEQQRVAIARAIAKRPTLLLCDEPTGALDYPTGKRVLEVIQELNERFATTTLVITHNAAIAAMAHRVLRLADGQVIDDHRNEKRLTPSELSW